MMLRSAGDIKGGYNIVQLEADVLTTVARTVPDLPRPLKN